MSFILDALKKLEEKRQQSAVPDLLTAHTPDPVKPAKRSIWPYLTLSALLLNALLLTIWLRPWNSKKQIIAEEPPVIREAIEDTRIHQPMSTQVSKTEEPPLQKSRSTIQREFHISGTTKAKPVTVPTLNASGKPAKENMVPKEEIAAVKEEPVAGLKSSPETPPVQEKHEEVTEKIQTASGERLSGLNELPPSIRQEIPEISISVHIYSDSPSERLVNINGSIRREGDIVASGIKLMEITETGVMLSYKDSVFFVKGF